MYKKRMTNKRKDRAFFRKTANKTSAINVRPMMFRGGIRL